MNFTIFAAYALNNRLYLRYSYKTCNNLYSIINKFIAKILTLQIITNYAPLVPLFQKENH